MRGKQLLGIFLMILVLSAMAAAAGLQLTAVSMSTQDNTTTITIRASGAFTHTEYRPSDDLLLVDLPGVSAGVLDGQKQSVQNPGISGYRVQSFQGTGGTDVARVELNLSGAPFVTFNQNQGALEVRITPVDASASAAAPAPAATPAPVPAAPEVPSAAAPAPPASQTVQPAPAPAAEIETTPHQAAKTDQPVWVRSVNVIRGRQGVEVEIRSNGPLKPTVTKISDPERIVVDLENARTLRPVQVPVKQDNIKGVRMALHEVNPPVTRVVVDLESPRDYELVPTDKGLLLKLRAPAQVASLSAPPVAPSAAVITPMLPKPAALVSPAASQDSEAKAVAIAASDSTAAAPAPVKTDVAPAQVATLSVPPVASSSAAVVRPMLPKAALAPLPAAQETESKPADTTAADSSAAAPAKTDAPGASAVPAAQATPAPAQEFMVVQPEYKAKTPAADPFAARAADAAAKFSGGKPEVALSNRTALAANLHMPLPVSAAQQPSPVQTPMYGKPKYTGEPISVNLKDVDLKDFFRLIHEISGLNIVLDPNVHGTLTLVLDDVPWDQALDIVLKNNGLERELDGNVLRIATVDTLKHEAKAQHEQADAQALAAQRITVTRFLSYAHAKDVLLTVKKLVSKRGEIVADERTNALIIVDIPQSFAEIDRVLTQLDRKTSEVEIEARVVAATRNFARDIGTQLGFGFTNVSTGVGGATTVGTSPITSPGMFTGNTTTTSGGTGPTTTTTGIPLFSNLPATGATSGLSLINIGHNYRLDAILTAAEQRGLVKILSRPRVVTQNNIQAVVRQGVRIPIVTAAQLNGPPTTTYVDAFLRLTVTPQITIDNTIFLNVDVENTTPDFSQEVGGNPTLLTQQALTQVLVTDGGTVVIGGVISTKNSVNIRQVPLLGSLPILGNLFKERAVQTETQELFFFITPKIIQT